MASSGIGVQAVILAAGAFVVGIVVGGLGPRGEVRELRSQVFQLERAAARDGSTAGAELARLITEGLVPPDRLDDDDAGRDGTTDVTSTERRRPSRATDASADEDSPPGGEADAPDPAEARAAAREALELRRTQARAALQEDIDPDPEQLEAIDRAVADMNDQLLVLARDFVASVPPGGEPSRRELLATGADVVDVLAEAEARMLDAMTDEQRAAVREEATDPLAWIDPELVDVVAPVAGERP